MATKKSDPRISEGKEQVNFITQAELLGKLKSIAIMHGHTNSEVYNLAFAKFVELYEKKNGEVKPGLKKKDIKL